MPVFTYEELLDSELLLTVQADGAYRWSSARSALEVGRHLAKLGQDIIAAQSPPRYAAVLTIKAGYWDEANRRLARLDAVYRTPVSVGGGWVNVAVGTYAHAEDVARQLGDIGAEVAINVHPKPVDDTDQARGQWLLDQLRQFAWSYAPDPFDEGEAGQWTSTDNTAAEFVYRLLTTVGLDPA